MASKVQRHLRYLLMGNTFKKVKLVDGLFKHNLSWVYEHQRTLLPCERRAESGER